MVVGAGNSRAATAGIVFVGRQNATVIDTRRSVSGTANGSDIPSLTDAHTLEHEVADGSTCSRSKQGNGQIADNGEGAVGLGLGCQGTCKSGDAAAEARGINVGRDDIAASRVVGDG